MLFAHFQISFEDALSHAVDPTTMGKNTNSVFVVFILVYFPALDWRESDHDHSEGVLTVSVATEV